MIKGRLSLKYRALITAPAILPKIYNYQNLFDQKSVEIVVPPYKVVESLNEKELIELIIDVDGILCGDDKISDKVLQRANKLKVISKWGTGIDSIDKDTAERLGMQVLRVKDVFSEPVSDTVIAYILMYCRKIIEKDKLIRNNKWEKTESYTLKEKSLGVIGAGHIGKSVIKKAAKLGMKVYVNDFKPVSEEIINIKCVEVTSLEYLLNNSNFVSLHCDLNSSSFHLIAEAQLKMMQSNSIIINTSRGEVIDQLSLEKALERKEIYGAALDVFETEPLPKESKLRVLNNVLLSPHNSNGSPSVFDKVDQLSIQNLFTGLDI